MSDKIGKVYRFRGLRFYAKNGFICMHDEDDGSFIVLTRREFLERASALSDESARLRHMAAQYPAKAAWLSADRADIQFGIDQMVECTKEAKEQGDRTDPAVDAWFLKHRPARRSKVSLASGVNFATQAPGVLPLGNDTGKQVRPDFAIAPSAPKKLILPGE